MCLRHGAQLLAQNADISFQISCELALSPAQQQHLNEASSVIERPKEKEHDANVHKVVEWYRM